MNEEPKQTPEELEDAIRLLGASISFYGGVRILLSESALWPEFEKTMSLVDNALSQGGRRAVQACKSRVINLKRNKANPTRHQTNLTN
jgi:hypothetical protein